MKQTLLIFSALLYFFGTTKAQQNFNWTQIANYPYAAWGMNACSYGGYLYSFSNCGGGNNTLYRYDAAIDKWDTLAAVSVGAICNTSIAGSNGKLYLTGSGVLHVYDIATNTWNANTINTPTGFKKDGVASVVIGTDIYFVGGGGPATGNLFKFNTLNQTFSALSSMNNSRENAQAAHLNGKIYVIGGRNLGTGTTSGEVYDIATDQWTNLSVVFSKRYFGYAVADASYIYIMGGETGTNSFKYKTIEVYDPTANSITILDTTINNMTREHTAYALGVAGNKLVAAAGFTNTPNNALTDYCEATNFTSMVSVLQHVKQGVDFNVYPNPAKESISIRISSPEKAGNISIYNISGSLLHSIDINQRYEISIDCSMFPSGTYVITIAGKSGSTQTQTVQVTR